MKRLTLTVVLMAILALAGTVSAASLTGSIYTAGVSKYLWRGQILADMPAIQPGLTLNFGKFTFSYWGSYHGYPDNHKYNESDYTISFADSVPYADFLTVKAGYTAYTFPYLTPSLNNSTEIFAGLSSTCTSLPYVTYYYDSVQGKGGYVEAGVSHTLTFGDFGFTGALTAGYNFGQWLYAPSFTVLGLNLAASYTIAGFVITPSVFSQLSLDSQYKSEANGSLSIAYNFSL